MLIVVCKRCNGICLDILIYLCAGHKFYDLCNRLTPELSRAAKRRRLERIVRLSLDLTKNLVSFAPEYRAINYFAILNFTRERSDRQKVILTWVRIIYSHYLIIDLDQKMSGANFLGFLAEPLCPFYSPHSLLCSLKALCFNLRRLFEAQIHCLRFSVQVAARNNG